MSISMLYLYKSIDQEIQFCRYFLRRYFDVVVGILQGQNMLCQNMYCAPVCMKWECAVTAVYIKFKNG